LLLDGLGMSFSPVHGIFNLGLAALVAALALRMWAALKWKPTDRSLSSAPLFKSPLLTRREQEVAALIADGLTNRRIAEALVISERTAEGHVERIRNKLGYSSRIQIAVWAANQQVSPDIADSASRQRTTM
jgi:DNA-binding NarL/FixJ family response regulator